MQIERGINSFLKDFNFITKDATEVVDYGMTKNEIYCQYDNGVKLSQVAHGYILSVKKTAENIKKFEEMLSNEN